MALVFCSACSSKIEPHPLVAVPYDHLAKLVEAAGAEAEKIMGRPMGKDGLSAFPAHDSRVPNPPGGWTRIAHVQVEGKAVCGDFRDGDVMEPAEGNKIPCGRCHRKQNEPQAEAPAPRPKPPLFGGRL